MANDTITTDEVKPRLIRIGGSLQQDIRTFADLRAALALDDAHWVLNSVSISALRADRRFLQYIDSDGNGRIRTDEVRGAIRFLLDHLIDGSGVDAQSDELAFASLDPNNPDTPIIRLAAENLLAKLGKTGADRITLADLESDPNLRENVGQRQDGIVTTADTDDPECAALIERIGKFFAKAGINRDDVAKFQEQVALYLAHEAEKVSRAAEIFPFGADTAAISAAVEELDPAVEEYFLNCETINFLDSDPDRPVKRDLSADPLDSGSIAQALDKLSLAPARADGALDLNAPIHPRYRGKLLALWGISPLQSRLADGKFTRDIWQKLRADLAAYRDWCARAVPGAELLAELPEDQLQNYASGKGFEALESAIQTNSELALLPNGLKLLSKLLLLQRGMIEFVRNFVSLADLFTPAKVSLLQTGKLVMDGRHLSLITPVTDRAEHKRIVQGSNICIAYIDVNFGTDAAPKIKTMAVAITSGQMQRLFIGKRGIFFDPENQEYDAKIIDFVEQPVSIAEALKSPFRRFGNMIATQTDKLFSARTSKAQQQLEKDIASGNLAPASSGAPANGGMGGLPMLMMGGGIGIAAIGSAAAFIAKTVSNVSIWCILSVILGIIVVFGGPSVVIALVKLYCRDLGRFLEAAGNAVNHPMRLSRKLGAVFTKRPPLPPQAMAEYRRSVLRKILIFVLILALIGAGVLGFLRRRQAQKAAATPVAEAPAKVETTTPAPTSEPAPAPATPEKP